MTKSTQKTKTVKPVDTTDYIGIMMAMLTKSANADVAGRLADSYVAIENDCCNPENNTIMQNTRRIGAKVLLSALGIPEDVLRGVHRQVSPKSPRNKSAK